MRTRCKLEFESFFHSKPQYVFSAPGRTELGGNHTDHQHGCVLAAAVNLETVAAVSPADRNIITLKSEGYPVCSVDLSDLSVHTEEEGSTSALIRGVATRFRESGYSVIPFNAYVLSDVLPGSGLSSSAAFEVLIGTILNILGGNGLSAIQIAQFGQYAENIYFGKPCGLMDQMASSVGNIVAIDFRDPDAPVVTPVPFDFSTCGYSLCIVDSGANHANLTDEYAAVPSEMSAAASFFGHTVLRDVEESDFYSSIPELRSIVGDRAVLRCIHFFEENRRAVMERDALLNNDFNRFLSLVRESGLSSWTLLQNIVPSGYVKEQAMAVALSVSEHLLGSRGASRVHGGGFAGTIQAFVPEEQLEQYKTGIEAVLGAGSCHVLSIRPEGGVLVETL